MRIGVVVPCTDGKRFTAAPVQLRGFTDIRPVATRANRWVEALGAEQTRHRAVDLYKGVGWSASCDLVSAAGAQTTSVVEARVISAGLGLLSLEELVPSYSATFVPGHPDSVSSGTDPGLDNRSWWAAVNKAQQRPAPLQQLADELDGLVVAASDRYVDAISDDLAAALDRAPIVIFSSGRPRDQRLCSVTPIFDRRLREGPDPLVRANDQSLNQRVAAAAIRALGTDVVDVETTSAFLAARMERPPPTRYARRAATDETVARFIERVLLVDPAVSKSRLLRQWRDADRACEQRRFGRIFDEVRTRLQTEEGDARVSSS